MIKTSGVSVLKLFERSICVLGIETSCDNTGMAIVDSNRKIYANVMVDQNSKHVRFGGIIPPMAQNLHRKNIELVFNKCIEEAKIDPHFLDAIAVTNKPGLPLSLLIGVRYAKSLARRIMKPLLPIHHMEAHALTIRMEKPIEFPYLCLLISGGHCQLVFVENSKKFYLLGETLDDAPGEMLDKVARRLKLFSISKYQFLSGGQAIEKAASESILKKNFRIPVPLAHYRNCNFSFAGIKNSAYRFIQMEEKAQNTPAGSIISNYREFCYELLQVTAAHLLNRTQRALTYCVQKNMFKEKHITLVISGGVAANDEIFKKLNILSKAFNCEIIRPSKIFCSDNGAMIAWNGIEKILDEENDLPKMDNNFSIYAKTQLGINLKSDVENCNIKSFQIKNKNDCL